MAERQAGKPEIASQKKSLKLAPAIGDWTTYKPLQVSVKRIKSGLYGFDRLSQKEIDLCLTLNYRFTEKLLRHFKIDLQLAVELFTVQVEQTTYLNFLRTISGAVVQARITLPDRHESIVVVLELPLANSIINHALGSRDLDQTNRGLTEAENDVLSAALTEYLPSFEQPAFSIVGSPDVTLDPAINPSATFVSFTAEIALGDNPPAKMTLGYPGSLLKSLLAAAAQQTAAKPLNFSRSSQTLLSKISIPVNSTLGETTLTTREINELEVGDVVTLNTSLKSAVPLKISKLLTLLCQPGIKNKKLAVRLADLEAEELIVEPPPLEVKLEDKPIAPATSAIEEIINPTENTLEEEFSDEDFADLNLDDETEETKEEI